MEGDHRGGCKAIWGEAEVGISREDALDADQLQKSCMQRVRSGCWCGDLGLSLDGVDDGEGCRGLQGRRKAR
jgi:hypothetical protein